MATSNQKMVIRTVADLAALSDAELSNCMSGLRSAIQARKAVHAKAVADGALAPDAPLDFTEYIWRPNQEAKSKWEQPFDAQTRIEDLPIRRRAMFQLKEMRILVLEDVSALTESQLASCKNLGATSVARLRELLLSIGLDFSPPDDPESAEYHRNRTLRRLSPEELQAARRDLPDDAPVTRLGMHPGTIERALRADLRTVGDLRNASLRTLGIQFGRAGVKEIVLALKDTGTGLRCSPTQMELWRSGVLEFEQLRKPTAVTTPVTELRPWVGAAVDHLDKAGLRTLGHLKSAAAAGRLVDVRFLGDTGREKVLQFLGLSAAPRAPAGPTPSAPANSVFALGRLNEAP